MSLKLITQRRNNSIFADENAIYKIFNKDYLKENVFDEATVTARVEALGISVPTIEEVSFKDGQWVFKSNLINGKTLFELMEENPEKVDEYLDLLVSVQTNIHKHKCPQLPILKEKLTNYIKQSGLDEYTIIDLLDVLNGAPKHKKLCHGNFTPHNVVIDGDKVYIIDWNHANQGNASADVARTYLWLKMYAPNLADNYLKKFCDTTSTSSKYVKNWIPIVAAARLAKNNPEETEVLNNCISISEF